MLLNGMNCQSGAQLGTREFNDAQRSIDSSGTNDVAPPVAILGIPLDNVTLREAVSQIQEMISAREPRYVVTPNVDFLVQARRDATLRRILVEAHLALCDGTPLVWASRWLGNPLPERVAGADLVPELIREAAIRQQRLFFLGATPEANVDAVANVRRKFPNAIIAGHYSPPFQPLEKMDHADIVRRIRQAQPDLLFVAFGCPKAEKWIAMNYRRLGVPVVIGVGATIDFLAGRVRRAPCWMQSCGIEWVFRMWQEPRRLFGRYASDVWHFSWGLLKQMRFIGFPAQLAAKGQLHSAPDDSAKHLFSLKGYDESAWAAIKCPARLDVAAVRNGKLVPEEAPSRHCALDLAKVRFIDSTGVAWLLQLQKKLRAAGKQMVLLSPSRNVERALRAMRIEDCFVVMARPGSSAVPTRALMLNEEAA